MRNFLKYLAILFPWFIGRLFIESNSTFYQNLNLPIFTPPTFVFGIIWTILYILIALSIYIIYRENKIKDIKDYNKVLSINYLFNIIFGFAFFSMESPFLGFVISLGIFISSLFLYYETKKLNDTSAKILIPYIIWVAFATILSLTIYFMNF